MFGFVKRFRQINGYEPMQSILLAEYAYFETVTPTSSKKERKNVSIIFNFYKTNSAKLLIKTIDRNYEYHVKKLPRNFNEEDLRIELVNDNNQNFIFFKNFAMAGIVSNVVNTAFSFTDE